MAKRVTVEDVAAEIVDEEYFFPRGQVTTICVLTLRRGRQVVGAVFGQSFNPAIGKEEARKKAVAEIWPLMVYHAHQLGDDDAAKGE